MGRGAAKRQGGGRCAAVRLVDALQLTASPQGPQGPFGARVMEKDHCVTGWRLVFWSWDRLAWFSMG